MAKAGKDCDVWFALLFLLPPLFRLVFLCISRNATAPVSFVPGPPSRAQNRQRISSPGPVKRIIGNFVQARAINERLTASLIFFSFSSHPSPPSPGQKGRIRMCLCMRSCVLLFNCLIMLLLPFLCRLSAWLVAAASCSLCMLACCVYLLQNSANIGEGWRGRSLPLVTSLQQLNRIQFGANVLRFGNRLID